jgi:ABC-type transporter Mla MlaB component
MDAPRVSCAVNLDLSRGCNAASARIEWLESESGERASEARLALSGWLDRGALERFDATLVELSDRGVSRVQLDCSRVRHIEFAAVRTLTSALARFAPGGLRLGGLSPHLRDLFRLAGCGAFVPTGFASGLLATLPSGGPQREWAT